MTTIAFTRPARRLDESVKLAESIGFKVYSAPSLDIVSGSTEDFVKAYDDLASDCYSVAIFSSPTAAEECRSVWGEDFASVMDSILTIPIGSVTKKKLEGYGIKCTSPPEEYSSDGIVKYISSVYECGKVLIVHSDKGSPVLTDGLNEIGVPFDELIAYRLEKHKLDDSLEKMRDAGISGEIDWFLFTSRMSVDSFIDAMGDSLSDVISGSRIAAIGTPTAERLKEQSIGVDLVPEKFTFGTLLEAVLECSNIR